MSLEVNHLCFGYHGKKLILNNISFELKRGEVLSLLGPNGTGKTTLLKCINQIISPQKGEVLIDGENVSKMSPAVRAKRIGYVPQYHNAVFPINVIDTIMMGRTAFAGYSIKKKDKEIVFHIIEKMGLEGFAFQLINQMSGGERQRVFIARALAQEPDFIVLDEPTSSLDLKNQLFTLELITALAREKNIGVLISIHDLNLSAMFSDKIVMLKNAEIYSSGKPDKVLTKENISNVYGVDTFVSTEENFIHVRLKKRH